MAVLCEHRIIAMRNGGSLLNGASCDFANHNNHKSLPFWALEMGKLAKVLNSPLSIFRSSSSQNRQRTDGFSRVIGAETWGSGGTNVGGGKCRIQNICYLHTYTVHFH